MGKDIYSLLYEISIFRKLLGYTHSNFRNHEHERNTDWYMRCWFSVTAFNEGHVAIATIISEVT